MIVRYVDLSRMIHVSRSKQEAMCRRPEGWRQLGIDIISGLTSKLHIRFFKHNTCQAITPIISMKISKLLLTRVFENCRASLSW